MQLDICSFWLYFFSSFYTNFCSMSHFGLYCPSVGLLNRKSNVCSGIFPTTVTYKSVWPKTMAGWPAEPAKWQAAIIAGSLLLPRLHPARAKWGLKIRADISWIFRIVVINSPKCYRVFFYIHAQLLIVYMGRMLVIDNRFMLCSGNCLIDLLNFCLHPESCAPCAALESSSRKEINLTYCSSRAQSERRALPWHC